MRFFWIFCAVFVCCDAFLVSRGLDGVLWIYKTEPEQRLQQALIERANGLQTLCNSQQTQPDPPLDFDEPQPR